MTAPRRPDNLPRGWLAHKLETDVVRTKIKDPEVAREMIREATTGFDLGVRIIPEDLPSRRWPDPPPES
jgi:hypothetical protein